MIAIGYIRVFLFLLYLHIVHNCGFVVCLLKKYFIWLVWQKQRTVTLLA